MNTPQLQALADDTVAQLEANLETTFLSKSYSRVLAKVQAGMWMLVYKYAGFMLLQMFVAHATDRPTVVNGKTIRPLLEWGRLLGAGDPWGATRAELVVAVPAQIQSGVIPAGTLVVRPETQVVYEVVAEVRVNAPIVNVTIRATSDPSGGGGAGTIGNLQVGDKLELARTLPNVASQVTVVATNVTGANAEDREHYRARIMRRAQRQAQGGAYADYQVWAEEVPGIENAYPYSGQPGEVDVYVEASVESSGSANGIPTAAQRQAVYDSIHYSKDGLATRRPVLARVNVLPIKRTAFDVVIVGLEPDTEALRTAIETGIEEYLRTREPFIEGLSALPREDRITQAALNGIADGIVNASGGSITSLLLSPGPFQILGKGEKARLGAIQFL